MTKRSAAQKANTQKHKPRIRCSFHALEALKLDTPNGTKNTSTAQIRGFLRRGGVVEQFAAATAPLPTLEVRSTLKWRI